MDDDFDLNTDALVDTGVQAASATDAGKRIAAAVASGAALGAAVGTVIPGLGNAIGAGVGAIAGVVAGVAPTIASALHGQCTITIAGQDADCRNYAAENVKEALRYAEAHPAELVTMTPAQYSANTHVLEQDFRDWFPTIAPNYPDRIRSSGALDGLMKLPGARSILRVVQVPAAAAVAAASPELLPLYRATFPQAFPALTAGDIAKIVAKVQPQLDAMVGEAAAWRNAQAVAPTADQIHARFPHLLIGDTQRIAALPMTAAQTANADIAKAVASGHIGGGSFGPASLAGISFAIPGLPDPAANISRYGKAAAISIGPYLGWLRGNVADLDATIARAKSGDALAGLIVAAPFALPSIGGGVDTIALRQRISERLGTMDDHVHITIPVGGGTPSISLGDAHGVVAQLPSDQAAQYVQDTIAGARTGNPTAVGNANALDLAQRLQVQAKYVRQWVGPAAASAILSGLQLAVAVAAPARSPAPAGGIRIATMVRT